VAGGTYAFAQYQSLKGAILVTHQGESSAAILTYDPNNKASLDTSQFTHVGDGRFNILVVGVGGEGHAGAYLTDSMQIASLDTINKTITYTSVPRDLYTKIPGYGDSKINAAYEAGEAQKAGNGPVLDKEVVSNVLGVRISNFILIDFTAAKDVVNDLGGVDVDVPTTLNDPLYPCPDPSTAYCPFYITAGEHHMDGDTALEYSRSRETTSDFDRSMRQQLVVEAIKQKAFSLGFLTNPVKITSVLNALGQHVKTDLTIDQITSLISQYKNADKGGSFVLDTTAQLGLLTSTTDPTAGYIEYPLAGTFNYTDVHTWFAKNNPDPLIAQENPTIVVAGTGKATQAQLQAVVANLKDYGYTASLSQTTAPSSITSTQIYDTTHGSKPVTRNYLGSFYGVTVKDGSPLSSGATYELIYVPTTAR
jgi:LCP family protein required for cell wall assembly